MDAKLTKIYYSPQGYWKGVSAIKKLTDASKVSENVVKQWLYKQDICQIYLPAPRYTFLARNLMWRRPTRSIRRTFFFLPHDKPLRRKKGIQICVDCCRHRQPLQRGGAADLERL